MKVYLHIYIKNSIALMNRNVESLHEGKKLLSKKGNEGKKPSILHTISFTTPGTFCMFFFKDYLFWRCIYINIKKPSIALIKTPDHVFGCVSYDIFFFLINHTKRSAIGLRKLQSLLRNKLSDYCLKKPELIYQSRMKGSICYCSVQSTTGLACC